MKDQESQATKPAAASAKATEPKEEGKGYTSFNHIERDRLRQLGLRERWFYLEIKGISNFFYRDRWPLQASTAQLYESRCFAHCSRNAGPWSRWH